VDQVKGVGAKGRWCGRSRGSPSVGPLRACRRSLGLCSSGRPLTLRLFAKNKRMRITGKPLNLDPQKGVEALAHSGSQAGNSPFGFGHRGMFVVGDTGDDQGDPSAVRLRIDPTKVTGKPCWCVIGEVAKRPFLGPNEKPVAVEVLRNASSHGIKDTLKPDTQQSLAAFRGKIGMWPRWCEPSARSEGSASRPRRGDR
jgi:hypothetical protein